MLMGEYVRRPSKCNFVDAVRRCVHELCYRIGNDVEMTRDMAQRFNHLFGETLVVPEPLIQENVATVPGTDGQKMSKSKGNVIDPLEVTEQYGVDAMRFTLATMAAQARDVKLDLERVLAMPAFAALRNVHISDASLTSFPRTEGRNQSHNRVRD